MATPLPATPQENLPSQSPYRLISFLNPDGSQSLIEGWSWEPATSNDNAYRISSGGEVLTVISGPGTNLARSNVTAPLAAYPLSGDFQVKVKLQFTGNAKYQVAGIGLRSRENPSEWIALFRYCGDYAKHMIGIAQMRKGGYDNLLTIPYAKNDLYLSIKRYQEKLSFLVGENDVNWYEVDAERVFPLPADVDLFLYTYSTTNQGLSTDFSELAIADYSSVTPSRQTGPVPFFDPDSSALQPMFGWFPGESLSSSYRVSTDSLMLITGPKVTMWEGNQSAPRVEFPITGNFEATVRMRFDGKEKTQVGAFGLRSGNDMHQWIRIERASQGEKQQYVQITKNEGSRGEKIVALENADNELYLRIRYEDPTFSFFISSDHETWQPVTENFVMSFPGPNYLFFTNYSTSAHGQQVEFSEFTVTAP